MADYTGTTKELADFVRMVDSSETATADERKLAKRDVDYYDGKQWTDDEVRTLKTRGQAPVVFNLLQKKVNFLCGAEIRTRVKPEALPRTPRHDVDSHIATDGLNYVIDCEKFDTLRSNVYEDMLKAGWGGCLVDIEMCRNSETYDLGTYKGSYDGKPAVAKGEAEVSEYTPEIKLRRVHWDRYIRDPVSREPDFCDAEYHGIVTWMDYQNAMAVYAKKPNAVDNYEEILAAGFNASTEQTSTFSDKPTSWYDGKRKRLKIIELYYREGDDWIVCHFTKTGVLVEPQPTGFLDQYGRNECPVVMTSAYVADANNERYGVLRALIWPQDEVNKRRSKALHLMNTRQTIAEESAFKDAQEARTELAKPDGFVVVNDGALRDGSFQIQPTNDLAQAHFQMLTDAKSTIDMLGPSLQEAAGDRQVMSGRAIVARHQAATMELEPVFDNLRAWQLAVFKQVWCRIRQFKKEEWWVRVTDDAENKGFRFVALNKPMTKLQRVLELINDYQTPLNSAFDIVNWPEGVAAVQQISQMVSQQAQMAGAQIDPQTMQNIVLKQLSMLPQANEMIRANDVAGLDVDIVLDVTPDTSAIQSEQFEQLVALRQSGMEIPTEVILEASSLPNKKALIDMLTSQKQQDPAAIQMQQQQMALQLQLLQAQVALANSQSQANAAQAAKLAAETQAVIPEAQAAIEADQSTSLLKRAQAQETATNAQATGAHLVTKIQKDQATALKATAEATAIANGANSPDTTWDNANPNPHWPR